MRELPYHLNVGIIGRKARGKTSGQSAVGAAAYRAGQKLEVAPSTQALPFIRKGRNLHDYTRKNGVVHSRVMAPVRVRASSKNNRMRKVQDSDWFMDREKLWNAVEASENRKDSQLARELNLFLPHVTSRKQNIKMVEEFIEKNFTSKGMIADYSIHEPNDHNDNRNIHVHIMLTTRRVEGRGFHEKKETEWNNRDNVRNWRYDWAEVVNRRINPMGYFVDYRSHKERGLDIEPQAYEGPSVANSEWQKKRRDAALKHNAKVKAARKEKFLNLVIEKKAIFDKVDIMNAAMQVGYLPHELDAIRKAKLASGELIQLRDKGGRFTGKFTTKAIRDQEEAQMKKAKELAARAKQKVLEGMIDRVIQTRNSAGTPPTADQTAVVEYVTSSGGFKIVKGPAGTGKSFTLKMIKEIYEQSGYRIIGLSHTNKVVNDMKADGFEEGYTLSRFLLDQKKWKSKIDKPNTKTVIMVDEAAMMSLRQDEALFKIVEKSGAKLVYVGDENQFPSIDRGNAFGRYAQEVGYESLETIMRQRNDWDKKVSRMLGTGIDMSKPLADAKKLKRDAIETALKNIREHAPESLFMCEDDQRAMHALVGEWIKDASKLEAKGEHQSRFIIAQTNKQVNALNDIVQRSEIEAGRISVESVQQFETVRQEENPHTGELEVKDTHIVSVGVGSRIQFARTDHDFGIANGLIGRVTKIQGSKISVELDESYDGQTSLSFDTNDYADFALGYAGTNYKAQGKTFDTTYVLDSHNWTSNSFYVAMSRARNPRKFFYSKQRHPSLSRMADMVARSDEEAVLSTEFKTVSRKRTKSSIHVAGAQARRMPRVADNFDQASDGGMQQQISASMAFDDPGNDNEF